MVSSCHLMSDFQMACLRMTILTPIIKSVLFNKPVLLLYSMNTAIDPLLNSPLEDIITITSNHEVLPLLYAGPLSLVPATPSSE